MKKLSLLFGLLMGLFLFASCSSDDDSNSDNSSASLIGKWQLSAESYAGSPENLSDCEKQQTIEFFSNGTAENYYVDNGPCNFSTITVEYVNEGDTLIFEISGEGSGGGTYITTATIEVLNDTTLKYEFISDNEIGTYPEEEKYTQTYIRLE